MKLVAVSVVENEADVIEAFVRHTCGWVDEVLVCDRASIDGTREIVAALAAEGLPVRIFAGGAADEAWEKLREVAERERGADAVLRLRSDEFIVTQSREVLERVLEAGAVRVPASDYAATEEDDAGEPNPVVRIAWRQKTTGEAAWAWIGRGAAGEPERLLVAGEGVEVARFATRSPLRLAANVIRGELTKLSRGQEREGLDTHFRLGFMLLAEDPRRFATTVLPRRQRLEHAPVAYRGGPLRYSKNGDDATRGLRLLLPFLEELAKDHGRLLDGGESAGEERNAPAWYEIDPETVVKLPGGANGFEGFEPGKGWERLEGPYAPGFLPEFRWTLAPEAVAVVRAERAKKVWIEAEMLTYAERQLTTVIMNGVELARVPLPRVNHKEVLRVRAELEPGENRLVFRHRTWIDSTGDPRKLAVIFLGLRVQQERRPSLPG